MLATQNITAAMLKDQNKTAAELLGLGFPPKVLVAAGFTATELSNAGVNEETIASLVTVTQNSANTTGHKDTAIGVGVGVFAALFAILVGVWYWKRKSTNRNEYANTVRFCILTSARVHTCIYACTRILLSHQNL